MTVQAPTTVKGTLDRMHRYDDVPPATQGEFVWDQDCIARLFDLLMRGYQIYLFPCWKSQRSVLSSAWVADVVSEGQQRQECLDHHDQDGLVTSIANVDALYPARRARSMARLDELLRRPAHD